MQKAGGSCPIGGVVNITTLPGFRRLSEAGRFDITLILTAALSAGMELG
jgi:hypothetical protein